MTATPQHEESAAFTGVSYSFDTVRRKKSSP
jgi:hypothetical protein